MKGYIGWINKNLCIDVLIFLKNIFLICNIVCKYIWVYDVVFFKVIKVLVVIVFN